MNNLFVSFHRQSEPAALDAEQNTTSAIEATTPIFPGDMATAVEENQSPVAEVGDRENVQEMKETLLEHEVGAARCEPAPPNIIAWVLSRHLLAFLYTPQHASELLVETKHVVAPSAITAEAKYRQAAMDMILAADPLTWTGMELMMASAEANSPYQPPHNCCYMYQEPVDSASFY